MRRIDDMLKRIPLDELKGGIAMNRITNIESAQGSGKAVMLKRRTSGIIAAALVLVLGGGALAFSLTRNKPEKAAIISQSEAVSAADAEAEKIYDLIRANISVRIADGYVSEIKDGGHTADLSSPDEFTASMLSRTYDDGDYCTVKEFEGATKYIGEIPTTGKVFYHISDISKLDFVQYQSADGALGQYATEDVERTAFGEVPESLGRSKVYRPTEEDTARNSHAKAAYEVINRLVKGSLREEYPNNIYFHLFPDVDGLVLDFDKRERYADFIDLIEKYNTGGVKLTGMVYLEYAPGNDIFVLEWTDGNSVEIWPYEGVEISEFGRVPRAGTYLEHTHNTDLIGCGKYVKGESYASYQIARSNKPEVFEWYEAFLEANYEPVAFDASRQTSIEKVETIVSFEWYDAERNESVFIRTSDMEGANIYVNGRYYDLDDVSVQTLLGKRMPPPFSTGDDSN